MRKIESTALSAKAATRSATRAASSPSPRPSRTRTSPTVSRPIRIGRSQAIGGGSAGADRRRRHEPADGVENLDRPAVQPARRIDELRRPRVAKSVIHEIRVDHGSPVMGARRAPPIRPPPTDRPAGRGA